MSFSHLQIKTLSATEPGSGLRIAMTVEISKKSAV